MSTPEEHRILQRLVEGAIAQPLETRSGYLARQCAGDTTLLQKAQNLLDLYSDEEPAAEPQRIGFYRLVKEIGSGGMGVVYLAEREGGFHRKVAIKIIRRGMDTDYFLSRFHQEREILGALDHPGIVRIVDAGSTDDGRPYLVMDFVDGVRIDHYCDDNQLPLADRIRLFVRVCHAVEHAHQNLIVHRDLKPGNILVTPEGQPKLLDFGIAKVIDQDAPDLTSVTIPIMTRQYASPEQIGGRRITTSSDLYALGLILYELLAQERPYDLKDKPVTEAGRIVCENDPPLPSQKAPKHLAQVLRGDLDRIVMMALRKEADQRYASVGALAEDLNRYLQGRAVRAQRRTFGYLSAKFVRRNRAAVAAGLAIAAVMGVGAGSTFWQARVATKERQRAEFEAAEARRLQAAASEQARIALRERDRAESEWKRAEAEKLRAEREIAEARKQKALAEARLQDLRAISNSMLFEIHAAIRDLPGATDARRLLISKARTHLEKLAAESSGNPQMAAEVAAAYEQLGQLQGGSNLSSLGDTESALENQSLALALRQKLADAHPGNRNYQLDLAASYLRICEIQRSRKQLGAENRSASLALAIYQKLHNAKPSDTAALQGIASSKRAIGLSLEAQGRISEAKAVFASHTATRRLLQVSNPDDPELQMQVAEARDLEARMVELEGRFAEAAQIVGENAAIYTRLATIRPHYLPLRTNLAQAYRTMARLEERTGDQVAARAGYQKALDILEELGAKDPKNSRLREEALSVQAGLGMSLFRTGHNNPAVIEFRRAIAAADEILNKDPQNRTVRTTLVGLHQNLGQILLEQGNDQQASNHFESALTAASSLTGLSTQDLNSEMSLSLAHIGLGRIARDANRLSEAEHHFADAIRVLEKILPGSRDHRVLSNLAIAYSRMGDVHRLRGNSRQALTSYGRAIPLTGRLLEIDSRNIVALSTRAECMSRMALVEEGRGDWNAALQHYRVALELDEKLSLRDPNNMQQSANLAESRYRVCHVQQRLSRSVEALEYCRQAVTAWQAVVSRQPEREQVRRDLAMGLRKLGEIQLAVAETASTGKSTTVDARQSREQACRSLDESLTVWQALSTKQSQYSQEVERGRALLDRCRGSERSWKQ